MRGERYIESRVTRWLYYFSIFGHVQHWKAAQNHFNEQWINPQPFDKKLIKCCKSGESGHTDRETEGVGEWRELKDAMAGGADVQLLQVTSPWPIRDLTAPTHPRPLETWCLWWASEGSREWEGDPNDAVLITPPSIKMYKGPICRLYCLEPRHPQAN